MQTWHEPESQPESQIESQIKSQIESQIESLGRVKPLGDTLVDFTRLHGGDKACPRWVCQLSAWRWLWRWATPAMIPHESGGCKASGLIQLSNDGREMKEVLPTSSLHFTIIYTGCDENG